MVVRTVIILSLLWMFTVAGVASATGLNDLRSLALDLVNIERGRQGLPALTSDLALNLSAQRHAEDMVRDGYFSHVSPQGDGVLDRFVEAGGGQGLDVGENIYRCFRCGTTLGMDDVKRSHQEWMISADHRMNVLHPQMTRFGFGIAVDPQGIKYAVQTFAGPSVMPGAGSALARSNGNAVPNALPCCPR